MGRLGDLRLVVSIPKVSDNRNIFGFYGFSIFSGFWDKGANSNLLCTGRGVRDDPIEVVECWE